MMSHEIIIYGLWAFFGLLIFPLVICWALFGIAWLKGWSTPDITPMQILERLAKK